MENYSSVWTIICGTSFIFGGVWALILARWNLGRTKLERLGLIKLSPRVNKIITYIYGIAFIIFGILIMRFAIIKPALP